MKINRILILAMAFFSWPAYADQVITDDLIIQSSVAVGFDAANGEDFGFDTIRLKENNLRIRFDDTSNSGAFPKNDWQLTANDTTNGGRNYFAIDDVTGGLTPFLVEAAAPTNSLYVRSNGNLGLGTAVPGADIHISSADSPSLRFDQTATDGLAPQVWDVLANEAGWLVRDVTGGNAVPIKVRPGALSNSLVIGVNGLSVGAATGEGRFHVRETGAQTVAVVENTNATSGARTVLDVRNNGPATLSINNATTSGTPAGWNFTADDAGELLIQKEGTTTEFRFSGDGNLTVSGTVNGTSDRNRKENFGEVDGAALLERLSRIPVQVWNYRGEDVQHIGPMAQDFHEAFALGASERVIATVDADGVALASIQALHADAKEKEKEIEELRAANLELENRLSELEKRIGAR